jgi:BNR/Asp-box repeat
MPCAGTTAWRFALVAALSVSAAGCGAPGESLPAATPVTPSSSPSSSPSIAESVSATETSLSSIPGSVAPATSASTVGTADSDPAIAPVTGSWVNATEGLVDLPSECGNMSLVAARPDEDMLIASIAQQGLWSSTSGTDTWSRLGQGAGSATIINRGSTIIFDPAHPETFWESGFYNAGGVYRTDDGGVTFRQLGDITHVETLSVDFSDPARQTLLATTHESPVTFRSTDGGKTWVDITSALPTDIGLASGTVVIDAQTFLLGSSYAEGSRLLQSTDAGDSWTTVYDSAVIGRPLMAKSDGAMYWLLERVNGIIVSHDNGETWSLITPKTEILPTAPVLLELHDGSLASIRNGIVIISSDHGASWAPVGPSMPFIPTGMIYSPFRKAFYIWYFDCDFSSDNAIQPNSIMRLDFDPVTQ